MGHPGCKHRLARAARGCAQVACGLLEAQKEELVWMIRAFHGGDAARYERAARYARFCRGAGSTPGVGRPGPEEVCGLVAR